ncbi:MAG: hypothetical protein ACTSUO_08110 [Candidatus Thorarchaeota archaeon]
MKFSSFLRKHVLLVDERSKKKYIQVSYEIGSLRSQWNLGTPERQCKLMHALVDEISKYKSVAKIPKIEDSK